MVCLTGMGQEQDFSSLFDTERALNPSRAVIASTFMWLPIFIALLGHALGTVPPSAVGREAEWILLVAAIASWGITVHQVTHHNLLDWHTFRIPALVAALSAIIVANGGIGIVQNNIRHFIIVGGCLVVAGGLSFNITNLFFPMTNQNHNLARALALTFAVLMVATAAGMVATFFPGFFGIAFGLYAAIILLALGLLWVMMYRIGRVFYLLIMAAIFVNTALVWLYLLGGWTLLHS